jgi:hypothetical protein
MNMAEESGLVVVTGEHNGWLAGLCDVSVGTNSLCD